MTDQAVTVAQNDVAPSATDPSAGTVPAAPQAPAAPPAPEAAAPSAPVGAPAEAPQAAAPAADPSATAGAPADAPAGAATSAPGLDPTAPAADTPLPPSELTEALSAVLPPAQAQEAASLLADLADKGGPAGMVIAGLSVVALAVILWKLWRMARLGAWSRGQAARAVDLLDAGRPDEALAVAEAGRGARARFAAAALRAQIRDGLSEPHAREAAARQGRETLHAVQSGSRALELIATVAPLLGLLGTVLGMIEAFRQLQEAGGGADPAVLAGGIWQALLTTALGMAVAIPVTAALSGFDAAAERLRHDLEALGADIFARPPSAPAARAAVSAPGAPPEAPAAADDAAAWRAA
ncbi:outer membrane transport energization protein ExbB [Albimonas donghaensis]|uniref:Outer membrane transport energization protein ExbB n=1 Tax=Albimonas donghaensis TaxID=356660 RepID=A0A1H3BYJ2_9RHOB|nr:MotA/TolQ/ExbB proton channel family protein [Albimonas donghaensis]SDX46269.1 outer membrane transport energization protein ExbB [Albimonas donghaensis]